MNRRCDNWHPLGGCDHAENKAVDNLSPYCIQR